jgi:hypothetical protein
MKVRIGCELAAAMALILLFWLVIVLLIGI